MYKVSLRSVSLPFFFIFLNLNFESIADIPVRNRVPHTVLVMEGLGLRLEKKQVLCTSEPIVRNVNPQENFLS